eukprot:4144854-Pyramimonas_sp.AAC.1
MGALEQLLEIHQRQGDGLLGNHLLPLARCRKAVCRAKHHHERQDRSSCELHHACCDSAMYTQIKRRLYILMR